MKTSFAAAVVVLMLSGTAASAAPWCANTSSVGGFVQDCSYHTFGQCLATIRGLTGSCSPNAYPQVAPYPPPVHRKRHPRKRY